MSRKYPVAGKPNSTMLVMDRKAPRMTEWESSLLMSAKLGKKIMMGMDEFQPEDVSRLEYLDNHPDWEFDRIQPTGLISPLTNRPKRNYIYNYIGPEI